MSLIPTSVTITDDTMREGLQIESAKIPVDAKLRLLDALGDTGAKVSHSSTLVWGSRLRLRTSIFGKYLSARS